MKSKTMLVLAALFFFSLTGSAAPSPSRILDLEKTKSRVEFLSVGNPGAIKIRGKLPEEKPVLKGTIRLEGNAVSGSATVLLEQFDTGIELRNKHMKEKYLETQKWQTAELTLTKMTLPDSCQQDECEASKVPFEGTLSLHGVKKPVSGTSDVKKKSSEVEANFDFKFPLSDFGIETPSFMGVTVAQNVTVTVAVKGNLVGQ